MAKQDTWARITLRIPPELHEKLTESAAEKSLNAEIISRLEASFSLPEEMRSSLDAADETLRKAEETFERIEETSRKSDELYENLLKWVNQAKLLPPMRTKPEDQD